MSDLFEKAARRKTRIATNKGTVNAEDLWDVATDKRHEGDKAETLNELYIKVTRQLKEISDEGLTTKGKTKVQEDLELQRDLIKYVFEVKTKEAADRRDAIANRQAKEDRKAVILAALSAKDAAEISQKSAEELRKELEALNAE